jgi:hypothetical protein
MPAITTAHLWGLLAVIVIWFAPALLAARIASRKGRDGVVYLLAALFVSGFITLFAALIIRPRHDSGTE